MRVQNPLLQPWRVAIQMILPIHPPGNRSPPSRASHHEPENGEPHESAYEQEHDDKVNPQRPCNVETRAYEAG